MFIDGNRVPSGLKFYSFPLKDKAQLNHWCQLIRRQNNRDGFSVSKHSKICEKHFEKKYIYRPPGGTQTRLLKDAKPTLHEWNDFNIESSDRKAPAKRSPRKKVRYDSVAAPILSCEEHQDVIVSENLPIDFNVGREENMEEINKNLMIEIESLKSQLNESKEAYIVR